MDELFTPHMVNLDDPNSTEVMSSEVFADDALFNEEARKSMPLAFEKITTAHAILIKENPRVVTKAFNEKSRKLNLLTENIYYENFAIMRKIKVLRKYVYHLAKYGIAYWREYVKKTYKKRLVEDKDGKMKATWVYDIFDQAAENIHPKNVVLDDNCISVKDINKPANDLYTFEFLTKVEFDLKYPQEVYEKNEFVNEGDEWMVNPSFTDHDDKNPDDRTESKKIMVLTYENKGEGLREIWANQVPLESIPLPGEELSINGEKWVEDKDNYDGIGVGQVLELYQTLVDDIRNASLERLRQMVRPTEDHFNGVETADEADDVSFGFGQVRKWTGSPDSIRYTHPPQRSAAEQVEEAEMQEEIDRATMVPRNLGGTDDAKTAFQSAQNRESALNKLSLPLDAIKFTLEDAANLSLKLYKLVYQEPLETTILTPADDDFDEASAMLEANPDDERVVDMTDKKGEKIARRNFRQFEFPLTKEVDEDDRSNPTGRIVESEEKEFWEMLPKTFDWDGRLEIIGESFLPISKALEDERKKQTIDFLMGIPTTDELGNPVLKDANGQPFTIDRVRLAKERVRLDRNFDGDKIVVPLEKEKQVAGDVGENPLASKDKITLNQDLGRKRPELQPNIEG